jgi:YesN/AraC family two-component response regulator
MTNVTEVLLANDNSVVLRGPKATIEENSDLRAIAEAADDNDALRQIVA